MEFLKRFNSIEAADEEVHRMFKNKELIMGFGHRVYKDGDPRSDIIKGFSK
jgi:2-methylcitrate synthase